MFWKRILGIMIATAAGLTLTPASASEHVVGPKDRIGWSCDGNQNDSDDWSASAMALAIFAKAGWQSRFVHWDYGDRLDQMTEYKQVQNQLSVEGGAQRFGFDMNVFFNDWDRTGGPRGLTAAVENIAKQINASSEDSKFYYCMAGWCEVAYRGILAADPEKRKFCILISHSKGNEQPRYNVPSPLGDGGHHGIEDCVKLGASLVRVRGGNDSRGGTAFGGGRCQQWSDVDWLKNSPCPDYQWVFSRFQATFKEKDALDASDGTMAYALAFDDDFGSFVKLQTNLGTCWHSETKSCSGDPQKSVQ